MSDVPRVTLCTGCGEFLRVSQLHDSLTRTHYIVAAVTAVVRDAADTPVPGPTWPMTLERVRGAPAGTYRGMSEDINLFAGERYRVSLTADDGGTQSAWSVEAIAGKPSGDTSSIVLLAAEPWDDAADDFGAPVLGIAQMTATEWNDAAESFGSHTIAEA